MSRSKWKGPHQDIKLFKIVQEFKTQKSRKRRKIKKIFFRSSVIPSQLIGRRILVHTGKLFKLLIVKRNHVGFKFGQFITTRKYNAPLKLKTKK